MCEGIAGELEGIDLGDSRLNKRSERILEALAADPQASVNAACDGWGDTIAAYRFFDNKAVEPQQILQPHVDATKRRMRAQPVVLILQDTTELDFSSHPPDDAGCLDKENRFGIYDHTHLAVTPERLPLGVVGVEQFDRTAESLGKASQRVTLPIEEKESFRWLVGYRLASDLAGECPETQVVSVADREADIYDIFVEAQQHSTAADFVIRALRDRSTPQRDPDSGSAAYRKVRDEEGGLGFGTEVSWSYRVALRGGYNFNDNFLSKFSFGLSFRLDDRTSPVRAILPGRNSAMRVDIAGLEKNEFFSTSFLGAMNLYPIGPEEFSFVEPYLEEQTRSKEVILSWEESRDPDLFDDVNYLLLISKNLNAEDDSEKLREVIAKIEKKREKLFEVTNQSKSPSFWAINSGFVEDDQKEHIHYITDELAEGQYSWTVLAYDRDKHIRFVENEARRIRRFDILPVFVNKQDLVAHLVSSHDVVRTKWFSP